MTTDERNMKMHKTSGSRVDLYKLIKEYNRLNGNPKHPKIQHIIESYDLGLIEEEIRRVQEFIEDVKLEKELHQELEKDRLEDELRRRTPRRPINKLSPQEMEDFHMQDVEDRLMGRRTRRASDVLQSLNERIARLERMDD